MSSIGAAETAILLGSALVLAGILSSLVARRFGAPLLLIFLVIGMLAGEDGPGGISFNDYQLTYTIGSVALAIILFDGGMRTKVATFRVALRPALALATVGVVLTAALTAVFARLLFDLSTIEALLLGSILASTDAAAVFFLVSAGGLRLNERVRMTLEIESGLNDPVAVFLTMTLVGLAASGGPVDARILAALAQQTVIALALGAGGGLAISVILNRLDLPPGLQPLFVATAAVLVFALAAVLHGSGFLAIYIAGLVVGNRPMRGLASVTSFHDAATWFWQIVMFVVLGMLVTPSRLVEYAGPALLLALGLMLVARPVAVALCLAPFGFSRREILFIAWVGLRGAVGIFLASVPVLVGAPNPELYFNVAFVVVLVSLLVQGWTVAPVARWLGVALQRIRHAVSRVELDLPGPIELEVVGYAVPPDSHALGGAAPPSWARPVLVVRGEHALGPDEAGALEAGDHAYFLAPPWRAHLLDPLFAPADEVAESDRYFFGDFPLKGDVTLGHLADLYGLPILAEHRGRTIADHFAATINAHPVIGDRVRLGESTLIVRDVEGDRVAAAGLQLETPREPGFLSRLRARLARRR